MHSDIAFVDANNSNEGLGSELLLPSFGAPAMNSSINAVGVPICERSDALCKLRRYTWKEKKDAKNKNMLKESNAFLMLADGSVNWILMTHQSLESNSIRSLQKSTR